MEKIKLKRDRKKIFPNTIVVKISEENYKKVINLAEKDKTNKSVVIRKIIDIGFKNF